MNDQAPTGEYLDTGGCTEWSCPYHGEINRARGHARLLSPSGVEHGEEREDG